MVGLVIEESIRAVGMLETVSSIMQYARMYVRANRSNVFSEDNAHE